MKILIFLLFANYAFGQSVNPICSTDSCHRKFIKYTLYYGSFPMRCVKVNFVDQNGKKWSEIVYVVAIHNYLTQFDSSTRAKKLSSLFSTICNGGLILKDSNDSMFYGGYRINETIYNGMKSLTLKRFLHKYFDREGNILPKYNNYTSEVLACCFDFNITFFLSEYYYPAIAEGQWISLCEYYHNLKKLPKPKKTRYIE